jgi:hypothetical protein
MKQKPPEDRDLAEEGMTDYASSLIKEDRK